MDGMLSQEEINALLNGMGGEDQHRIQQQIQQQIQQHHRRRTLHLLTQIKMQLVKYPISVWELQQRH